VQFRRRRLERQRSDLFGRKCRPRREHFLDRRIADRWIVDRRIVDRRIVDRRIVDRRIVDRRIESRWRRGHTGRRLRRLADGSRLHGSHARRWRVVQRVRTLLSIGRRILRLLRTRG
jgi:hypothetical protein